MIIFPFFLFFNQETNDDIEFKSELRKCANKIENLLGKGYDKLEQWRRGEIGCIHPDEVDTINWNIYIKEKAKKQFEEWKKENPTYFEEERKRLEKWEKEYTKDMSEEDLMLYNLLKGLS